MSILRIAKKASPIFFIAAAIILGVVISNFHDLTKRNLSKNSVLLEPEYHETFTTNIIANIEKGNRLTLYSGGQLSKKSNRLDIGFSSTEQLDLAAARTLIFATCEEYLTQLKGDSKIKEFLGLTPIDHTTLDLGIIFYDQDHNWNNYGYGYIANVSLIQGIIRYKYYNPKERRLITLLEERYEDVLKEQKQLGRFS